MSCRRSTPSPPVAPGAVRAIADRREFGPLLVRLRHPASRLRAALTWGPIAVFAAAWPVATAVVLVFGARHGSWPFLLAVNAVAATGAVAAAVRATGRRSRDAFYLYPQGIVVTSASGWVRFAAAWTQIRRVEVTGSRRRHRCRIVPRSGAPVTFTELPQDAVVAPLAARLHATAVERARR